MISATPGPNMLLAFVHGLNYGLRRTLWTLLGLSIGLFVLLLAALLGLDVLYRQFPWALTGIKVLGALYLMYLGVVSWRSNDTKLEASGASQPLTTMQHVRLGIWVSLSNPKAILFFAALFPKFINFKAPLLSQYVILVIGFFVVETFWQLVYATGGVRLATWLQTGNRLRWLNRLCGVLFMVIAIGLLWEVFV